MTTGEIRASYAHVWQPQVPKDGGEPKYSITMLIPKTDTQSLNAIYEAIEAAKQQGVATKWKGRMPPALSIPIADGDGVRQKSGEPYGDECKGHMVMTCSSKNQPCIVDADVRPIMNRADFYSGCYARVAINFFAYDSNGNRGIGCGLNCVQKTRDGEPLAGGISAEEAFGGANAYVANQYPAPMPRAPHQPQQYPQSSQYQPQQYPQASRYQPQQPQYQQQTPQYQQPSAPQYQQQTGQGYGAIDPITGQPAIGGVMGI